MELNQNLIELIVAMILGFGGVEGGKTAIKYLKNKKNNSNNDFELLEPTNPGQDLPMLHSECRLRHLGLNDQIKAMNDTLNEIKLDTKKIADVRLDIQKMKGDIATQHAEIGKEIQKEVSAAIDKHELRFHKVA